MPAQNITDFILFIIPGFIAVQFYHRFYPVKERNSFIEIAWSITGGIIIISILKWLDKNWLNFYLHSNSSGIPDFRFTLGIIISGILVGITLVILTELSDVLSKRYEKLSWLSPNVDSIWLKINSPLVDDWAVVHLNDGSIFLGWIKDYTYNPNNQDQDFLLSYAKRVDEDLSVDYLIDGIGVYLNTRDVIRIEFFRGRS